ncbi:MAG: transcription termination/antitermination protein NusA [Erysipelotrichia bacterium]|nr:transcription termination/antitermination protein NusA [Erysipelotrichia bacterium]NCC53945.1 transcription termination/antitermination protein NusA [Erysipelotrichia bacterium]
MKLKDVVKAMQTIENDRSISKDIIADALKEALAKAYRKHIEIPDCLVRVDINEKTSEIKVYHQRLVVENVEDEELEISLADAQAIKESYALEDLVDEEVDINDFGRAAVILAKNVMKQKIREAEKQAIYDEYCDKLEDLVIGEIETVEEKFCLVNIGKALALMPKVAQIPSEHYREGQRIRVVISDVNKETKGAQVLVSRADPALVKRLFEKEVPEIYQGVIEIKAIAREAGERCKMAVYSRNENIDPIGACIGPKGQRVQAIIDELNGEKIDIFEWNDDISELIKNALAPADILAVIPSPVKNGLMVIVNDDQLSLAIGKKGKNARLAVKLTNNTIDIKSISDVEEMGIDWKTIAMEQQAKLEAQKAAARAKAQQEIFEGLKQETTEMEFNEELFDNEVVLDEFIPETITEKETISDVEESVEAVVEEAVNEQELNDLEEAARIAKEKKAQGINIEEKRAYVSKFEEILSKDKEVQPVKTNKYKKKKDKEDDIFMEEEIVRSKPTYEVNQKDYEMKPIYTEEELAEIEAQERAEQESQWINDDIDFDEYDEYYDEE